MMRQRLHRLRSCATITTLALASCASQPRVADIELSGESQQAQLERLNAFLGQWVVEGVVTTPGSGALLRITGFNEAAWDDEHLFLIGRGVSWIQGGGETHGLAAWAFDPGSGMFRSVTITDSGATAVGTARYDAATDSWRAQMTTHGPSGKTLWKGRIRFIDPNTKEERWTAYACGGLVKKMQITKTERRKRQP